MSPFVRVEPFVVITPLLTMHSIHKPISMRVDVLARRWDLPFAHGIHQAHQARIDRHPAQKPDAITPRHLFPAASAKRVGHFPTAGARVARHVLHEPEHGQREFAREREGFDGIVQRGRLGRGDQDGGGGGRVGGGGGEERVQVREEGDVFVRCSCGSARLVARGSSWSR